MAPALISALLEQLASVIHQQDEQGVRLVVGVEEEVENLKRNLHSFQGLIGKAEERQVKEADVRQWLANLKEVCCEIGDVLNEWNNEIQKLRVEKQEKKESDDALATKKKVCSTISSYYLSCRSALLIKKLSHQIKDEIKKLNNRLTLISKQRGDWYTTRVAIDIFEVDRPITFDIPNIIGRKDQQDILISKLLSVSSQEDMGPLVIPIIGKTGMGKTILAQLAYNDEKVKTHFDNRIWICVSDLFEETKIFKSVIVDLGKNNDTRIHSNELECLLECIEECVIGKRFLLVLDDVWTHDYSKWKQLEGSLQKCGIGSRILVTTRNEEVANMMGATSAHSIFLKELSEQDCRSLFTNIALSHKQGDESFEVIESIGKEIVKKCNGLPLAVKVLGGLMRYKETMKEWQDVLNNKMWSLDNVVEHKIFRQYYGLASAIRRCLLYCAIFPRDYKYDRDALIELWMAQNFLNSKLKKENEIIGQSYVDTLTKRSIFLGFGEDDGNISGCRMHGPVYDFVSFLAENECFIVEANDSRHHKIECAKVRHLTIRSAPEGPFPFSSISSDNWKNLYTLTTIDSCITTLDPNLISQLKYLRTLNLSHNQLKEVPKVIGELVHLRYIDLSHNPHLKKLPNTVCNLYNLQTLRLVSCTGLKKLPEAMRKLINLKHLHVKDCHQLKYLPKGIQRLTSLRRLDEYTVCGGDKDEAFKMEDLGILDQLRGNCLSIKKLGNLKKASEAEKAQLGNRQHLTKLELDFENEEDEQRNSDTEILNGLKPHKNLELLRIGCYEGVMESFNRMMTSLNSLRSLIIEEWRYCVFLPPLGRLPSLERLEISGMHSVKKVGVEFLGSSSGILFPKLKQLSFGIMQEWKEWEGVQGWREEDSEFKIMPCLYSLRINSCSLLTTLPDFLRKTPLHDLRIDWCPILAQGCQKNTGKEWPKISHIPNIIVDVRRSKKTEFGSSKTKKPTGQND